MLIPLLSGIAVGEGISRISRNEHCPRVVKKITHPAYEMLQNQYCVTLVSVTLVINTLYKAIIPKVQKLLMNRKGMIVTCVQTSLSIVGTCTFSNTFVLTTVIYIARRKTISTFLMPLQKLHLLLEELETFTSESLSDPSQVIEKFSAEIAEKLEDIQEVFQGIILGKEPEVITDINQQISSFEDHLTMIQTQMPQFRLKLDSLLKKIQEIQEKLLSELSKIEAQAKSLERLVSEIDYQSQGLCEGIIKKHIDFEKLKQRTDRFQELFEEGISLSRKAFLIKTGLDLIRETSSLEGKGIDLWFSMVEGMHLPMIQDMGLTGLSVPILIKELGRAYMNNQFRRDAFLNFKAKRTLLYKKFPDQVGEFRDGLIELRHARVSIFKHLKQITPLSSLVKEDWKEESEQITKGGNLIKKSSTSVQEKFTEDRAKRGLIKTFIA